MTEPNATASPAGPAVLVTPLGARASHSASIGDRDRFLAFAMCSADVLMELDSDQVIVYLAGAVAANLGQPAPALIGQPFSSVLAEQDEFMVVEILDRMVEYGQMEETLIRMKHRVEGGSLHKLILSGYHLPHLGGHYFLTMRKQFAKAIDTDAGEGERDTETGMLTGDSFIDLAGERLEALNADGEQFKMATVELENAAQLRDRLDEAGRKRFKQMVGAALRANSVGGDMAGDLGDDRFALIHDKNLDIAALEKRIMEQARALDPLGIGVAVKAAQVAVGSGNMSDDDATRALIYAIKQLDVSGSGAMQMSDLSASLSTMVADTAKRMADVRAVIDAGKFNTVFQPVVKLRGGEPHHYEALSRFDRGAINLPPYEVIRLAEDVGLVSEFDLATCRRCLEHLVGDARSKSDLPIAVNLSGRSLSSPAFIEELDKLLDAFAPVRKRLLIEITETVRLKDFTMARNYIARLREAGHKVCLDDFGAGEMQIDYLRQLDVDFVKIDGSYILGARKDATNKVLLKAVTSLCKELRIATIAEMVEDEDQVPFLQECHVMLAQGWLFGKPMDVPQMIYAKALKEDEARKAAEKAAADRAAAERIAAERAAASERAQAAAGAQLRASPSPFQAALEAKGRGVPGITMPGPMGGAQLRGGGPNIALGGGEAHLRGPHDANSAMPLMGRAAAWGQQPGMPGAVAPQAGWGPAATGIPAVGVPEAAWGAPGPVVAPAIPATGVPEATWGAPGTGTRMVPVVDPSAVKTKAGGVPDSFWAQAGVSAVKKPEVAVPAAPALPGAPRVLMPIPGDDLPGQPAVTTPALPASAPTELAPEPGGTASAAAAPPPAAPGAAWGAPPPAPARPAPSKPKKALGSEVSWS